jgi:hypothetical protein
VACPVVQNFSHYLTNGKNFGKKLKCVFGFYLHLLSETFLALRKSEGDMIKERVMVFM